MKKNLCLSVLFLLASINVIQAQAYDILVAKSGGNYSTVQAAINAVAANKSTRTVIYIKNGTYKEVITVASGQNNITLLGESNTGVILHYNNAASTINPSTGTAYGTGGSSSMSIKGSGFYACNLTIQNSYGVGSQAVAISVTGDKSVFNNVRFLGNQDTWYGNACRVYLKNCYLEGTTDFMFGSATAFFDGCSIYTKGGSAITAANTDQAARFGLVFVGCTVTGASGTTTLLGRGWGQYANTAFINCSLPSNILAAGWSDWGNAAADATLRYEEYGNTGAGASTSGRVSWSHKLTSTEAAVYNYLNVLKYPYKSSTADNWDPMTVINGTSTGSSAITSSAVYSIIAKHSGKGLDVQDASTANGGNIQQWNYVGATNQQFRITSIDGTYYSIVNINSAKGLDVAELSTVNGANIQQWNYSGGANQQFKFVSTGDGYYQIVNKNSGKCLDVTDLSTDNGANVQQYNCGSGANQRWLLNMVSLKSLSLSDDKKSEEAVNFEVSPSPALGGNFYVKTPGGDSDNAIWVEAFTLQGQKVFSALTNQGATIQSGLRPGIYMLKISIGTEGYTTKLIVK